MEGLVCPKCGRAVDLATRRCDKDGTYLDSESLLGVANTIDLVATVRDSIEASGPPSAQARGRQVGKYLIEDVLGRGGMGTVYRVRHRELGHELALKAVDAHFNQSPERCARFLKEAKLAARIGHPNIVQIFDFASDAVLGDYIVMELLRGSSLEELLAKEGSLAPQRAIAVALQICDAVGAAHSVGIIHRDIKPANIFVVRGGTHETAKVMDFGIAKDTDTTSGLSSEQSAIVGTPLYMSPEQWSSGLVDNRCDVYALGVVLYQMVTGELPYSGSIPELVRKVCSPERTPPSSIVAISAELEAVILKAIACSPADRFPSMLAMAEALRGASEHGFFSNRRRPRRPPKAKTPRRVVFAAGAALGIGVALAALVRRPAPAPTVAASTTSEMHLATNAPSVDAGAAGVAAPALHVEAPPAASEPSPAKTNGQAPSVAPAATVGVKYPRKAPTPPKSSADAPRPSGPPKPKYDDLYAE